MRILTRLMGILLAAVLAVSAFTSCDMTEFGGAQGEKGDKGEKGDRGADGRDGINGKDGRGILKVEIVDGWVLITYTDDPEHPVKAGQVTGTVEAGTDGLDYYLLPDGSYAVSAGKAKYLDEIVIPETHQGKPVTQILPNGFSCKNLTRITVPASITDIGDGAFSGSGMLTTVILPDGVKTIGNHAFSDCSSLSSVTIPAGITCIGAATFSGCSSLSSIAIPASVTSIGDFAFNGCSSLREPPSAHPSV